MFQKVKATSVAEYLAAVPAERKAIIRSLHDFIRRSAPTLRPHFASNMLGYGSFPYRNYKNEPIRWPVVALANQKQYVSIYICSIVDGKYVAERFRGELGKVSVGKSCIRFRKLEDLNLPVLRKVLRLAARRPGLATPAKRS